MDVSIYKPLGIGMVMFGALGAAYGLSTVFAAWLNGIARNPAAEPQLRMAGLIGFAGTELVLLMTFAVAALMIFV